MHSRELRVHASQGRPPLHLMRLTLQELQLKMSVNPVLLNFKNETRNDSRANHTATVRGGNFASALVRRQSLEFRAAVSLW